MNYEKAHEFYKKFKEMNKEELKKISLEEFKEMTRDEYIAISNASEDIDEDAFFAEIWGHILRERQMKIIKR